MSEAGAFILCTHLLRIWAAKVGPDRFHQGRTVS